MPVPRPGSTCSAAWWTRPWLTSAPRCCWALVLIGTRPCQAGRVTPARQRDREIVLGRIREVLDRLVRDGTAEARSDGTVHRLFPVAVGPAEGAALRSWVIPGSRSLHGRGRPWLRGLGAVRLRGTAHRRRPACPPRRHRPQAGHPLRQLRPAVPGRGRSRRPGGTSRRGLADHTAALGERRPQVRPRRRGRQPPIRCRLP